MSPSVVIYCHGAKATAGRRFTGWFCNRCGARVRVVW